MKRFLYQFILWALLPLVLVRLFLRGRAEPGYRKNLAERFGFYPPAAKGAPFIWVHAVSVGETRAALPLIDTLSARYPDHRILLTHMTPTGRKTGDSLYGTRATIVYLPYDYPFAVQRFLDHYSPICGILMETEIWFNLVRQCRQRQIPLFLANARLSEKSRKSYARFAALTRESLKALTILAQTAADKERFLLLGADHVEVCGNMKFDISAPPAALHLGESFRRSWGNRFICLAASTREGEEEMILDSLLAANIPDLLLLIVPRHPQRFSAVADMIKARNLQFCRRSENPEVAANIRVLLGDSMGEMFAYYFACDVAFIGGSLLPLGGQNLIEACSLGKPVLVGPHTFNFEEATRLALAKGAAIRVGNAAELAAQVAELAADEKKRKDMGQAGLDFARENRGAVERVMSRISKALD